MNGLTGPKQGEIAMALAELIRRDPQLSDEERREVRTVVSYQDDTVIRYQGCSCEYRDARIKVFYETWDDETKEYVIEEDMGQLISQLASIAEEVEAEMWSARWS